MRVCIMHLIEFSLQLLGVLMAASDLEMVLPV